MKHGYLIGTFDVLSIRDLDLIATARSRCDDLTVGLLTDDQVQTVTGQTPVTSLVDRTALVSRLRGVTSVVAHRPEETTGRLVLVGVDDAEQLAPPSARVIIPRRDTESTVVRAARRTRAAVA